MTMIGRAYSWLEIKSVEEGARIIRGIATSPRPDRLGDVVEPLGVQFKNPMPLLWQHQSDKPVGTVKFDKPTKDGITFEAKIAKIAEPGNLKDRVDEAWQSVVAKLVSAVSIGFRAIEHSFIEGTGGIRFLKAEVMELSLVTIPAQPDALITSFKNMDAAAIAVIKQFDIGAPAASGQTDIRANLPGVTGKSLKPVNLKPQEGKSMSKTIQEQIAALEAKHAVNAARSLEILQKATDDGLTTDAAQQEEFDALEVEQEKLAGDIKRYKSAERMQIATVRPVVAQEIRTVEQGNDARYRSAVQIKTHREPGTGLIRLMACKWAAKEEGRPAYDIARERFSDTPEVEMVLRAGVNAANWVQKTAVTAGNTTDSAWAGPLVVVNNMANEFLEYLRPMTILGRIPGLRMVPFNISVPRQLTETTGYWVGQGENKPVSSATFDTVTLLFHKLAAIAVITEELAKFSSPSAEATVRQSLAAAIVYRMDRDLLDPSKAAVTGVNPASLTNGVTPTTATGTTADAMRDDLGTMMSTYLQNNMGTSGAVLVMTEDQALKLSFMVNTLGQLEFPNLSATGGNIRGIPVITSQNVVATGGSPTDGYPIIAVHAPSILVADEGGVSIDISREASLQMNDSPDSPETTSTISVSLWQHNLLGIKAERYVTWVKGRAQAVQFIQNAKYQ